MMIIIIIIIWLIVCGWKAVRLGELVKSGTGSRGNERTFAGNEPPNKPRSIGIVYPWMVLQIDKRQRRIDCITGNIEIPPPASRRAMNTRTSRYASESGSSFDIPVTLIARGGNLERERNDIDIEWMERRRFGTEFFFIQFSYWLFLIVTYVNINIYPSILRFILYFFPLSIIIRRLVNKEWK